MGSPHPEKTKLTPLAKPPDRGPQGHHTTPGQHHVNKMDGQIEASLQTYQELKPYSTDSQPFPPDTDGAILLMAFCLEYYRTIYHPGLNSRKSWEQIYNIPKAMHTHTHKHTHTYI